MGHSPNMTGVLVSRKTWAQGKGLGTTEARTGVRKQTKRCQGLWQPQKLTEGQGTESVPGSSEGAW